jgi:hypothetical protein
MYLWIFLENCLMKLEYRGHIIYLPYTVDPVFTASVVTQAPMEVEGVHNVMVLQQCAVDCRGVLRPTQPFWPQHNFPRKKGHVITIFNNP